MNSQTREIKAFEALFKKMHQPLCNKVFALLRDNEAAADVVQNVFYKYWINRHTIIIHTSIEAYLYKACINEAHNHLKSALSKFQRAEHLALVTEQGTNTTDEAFAYQDTYDKIQNAITAMPPACKEVFLLSRYDGMSHDEIASHLSISSHTVCNHIKKALQIVKDHLVIVMVMINA